MTELGKYTSKQLADLSGLPLEVVRGILEKDIAMIQFTKEESDNGNELEIDLEDEESPEGKIRLKYEQIKMAKSDGSAFSLDAYLGKLNETEGVRLYISIDDYTFCLSPEGSFFELKVAERKTGGQASLEQGIEYLANRPPITTHVIEPDELASLLKELYPSTPPAAPESEPRLH